MITLITLSSTDDEISKIQGALLWCYLVASILVATLFVRLTLDTRCTIHQAVAKCEQPLFCDKLWDGRIHVLRFFLSKRSYLHKYLSTAQSLPNVTHDNPEVAIEEYRRHAPDSNQPQTATRNPQLYHILFTIKTNSP